MDENERLTAGEQGMAEDAYAHFIAALRYIVLEKKKIPQVALAKMTGVSHNHLNTVIHERAGKDGKAIKASQDLQQALAEALGYGFRDFLEMGERLIEGFPVEPKEPARTEEELPQIPIARPLPTDYMDPSEFRRMTISLAETYEKADGRLKMWRSYFEHLPFPALVVKQGIVVFQNARSRQWGQTAGSPLCRNCYERGMCNAENCENDDCPLCISINLGVPATKYRALGESIYKLDAAPFHSGGFDYVVLTAVEIDAAEIIAMVNSGAPVRPNRRKDD